MQYLFCCKQRSMYFIHTEENRGTNNDVAQESRAAKHRDFRVKAESRFKDPSIDLRRADQRFLRISGLEIFAFGLDEGYWRSLRLAG